MITIFKSDDLIEPTIEINGREYLLNHSALKKIGYHIDAELPYEGKYVPLYISENTTVPVDPMYLLGLIEGIERMDFQTRYAN